MAAIVCAEHVSLVRQYHTHSPMYQPLFEKERKHGPGDERSHISLYASLPVPNDTLYPLSQHTLRAVHQTFTKMFASECSHCHDKQIHGVLRQLSGSSLNSDRSKATRRPPRHTCLFVRCTSCGNRRCGECGARVNSNGRRGAVDHSFQIWTATTPDDSDDATTSTLLENCKMCPGCSSNVWKDGGCHAITCEELW